MNQRQFVDKVRHAMGTDVDPERVDGTLSVISRSVPGATVVWNEESGPLRIAPATQADATPPLDAADVPGTLAEELGMSEGHAVELFHTVCRVVDEGLDSEARGRFRSGLPEDVVATFARAEPVPPTAPSTGHRLADGQPGSSRPLSSASPAQEDSIARTDEPKSDHTLATATGTTQEREGRTLAEGKPGSSRSIAEES